ncbi:MAG: type IV pilus assembly protein PilM [Candidatus Omnitrophota bacterium]|jgi:type IV pilus assembly protein PilM
MKLSFKFPVRHAKDNFSLGLDIGSSAIKAVKLELLKESTELHAFNLEPAANDLEPVLKKILQSHDGRRVNISVSGLAAIIRYINFPKMKEEELKQALSFEAQKYIPFSLAEVNIDSYILKEDLPDNKMLVMLAAAKKEVINQRLKLLDGIGVKVNVIDIDSLALVNAFNFNYAEEESLKNKAVALLNMGAAFSNLNILEAGIPRLSRDIRIAGNTLTQKIADILAVEFKAAEDLKLNPDKERMDKVATALESALSFLAVELRTSFDYYESQSASTVSKIFLSGGGSSLAGVKDTLANLLGIEVEFWDPIKKISPVKDADAGKIKQISAQLAVAVGLALRR